MSYAHEQGIMSAGTGLPCRANCGLRFQPMTPPAFLVPRTRERFDIDALRDCALRRDKHELDVHQYLHGRPSPATREHFKEPTVMSLGRRTA